MRNKIDEIKKNITIPKYFEEIIVPQMEEYYSDYIVDFEVRPVVKCCLHDEDTPSMRWYEETNTYHCFGCRDTGDIISLHRKFTERMTGSYPSFGETLDFLYKYFLEGKTTQRAVIKDVENKEFKSTPSELARLSGYCNKLEGQLLVDSTISDESKRRIWEAIDSMHLLTSKNMVNASHAMSYIKEIVRDAIKGG